MISIYQVKENRHAVVHVEGYDFVIDRINRKEKKKKEKTEKERKTKKELHSRIYGRIDIGNPHKRK